MSVVSYAVEGTTGVIRIDNPPVNALSQAVRQGLIDALARAQADASKAILLICEGTTFVAGADIREFGKPPQPPSLLAVLEAIENSGKPVIAAMHGTALGGGLELALACHYRCAVPGAKFGLPEVKLGILPGAGGTQKVPRLMGVEAALELMTSGTPISAAQALAGGLLDKVFASEELPHAARVYASELIDTAAPLRRVRDMRIDPATIPADFFAGARSRLARRVRGQVAPERIVTLVEAATTLPIDTGLALERELFAECLNSPQSAAMRHAFFAEREAAKVIDLPADTAARTVSKVALIGAGTMGGGIAMNFINAGIPVTLLEVTDSALQKGLAVIEKNYRISAGKGRLTDAGIAQRLALIRGTTDYADLQEVDLVIEAVFEDLELKKQVFARLDAVCKPGCILATNTSYQDIDAIAAATRRPGDVIGMHFFSPANVMKLLENVRGAQTTPDVILTAMQLAKTIGKVPVLARVCYGFIGNRMLRYYGREAALCVIEGATPRQVDAALEDFGMAMGPLAMGDLAGLDVGYRARQGLTAAQKGDPRAWRVADKLVEAGRLGQKSSKGYYRYDAATRERSEDPEVLALIEATARELGVQRRAIDDQEILDRCLFGLVNEGARILEEGIAQRPGDIDVVYLHGYAFPAAKGGPMYYADRVGLERVYARICEFRARFGEQQWPVAPLLERLVRTNRSFADWARDRN